MTNVLQGFLGELQEMFPRYGALLTSRGTSALYLLLLGIRMARGPGEVIVPASVCPSVPLAVIYAGLTPRFCDVELDTFSLSERTVEQCISNETRAVIVVYLFGKSFDVRALTELSHRRNVLVIEDLALSIGGKCDGIFLGGFGDCSVISFNALKIVHGSAGVLLVQDRGLFQMIEEMERELPRGQDSTNCSELGTSFHELTHGLYNLMRARNLDHAITCLPQIAEYYRPLFLYKKEFSEWEMASLLNEIRSLPIKLVRRRRMYEIYQSHLDKNVDYVRFSPDEVCWRLPVLLQNHQQQAALIKKFRKRGMLISDHYFPVSHLSGDASPINAREIGLRAVNFWVDEKVRADQIAGICEEVNATVA